VETGDEPAADEADAEDLGCAHGALLEAFYAEW
jgi:hypothetical protein